MKACSKSVLGSVAGVTERRSMGLSLLLVGVLVVSYGHSITIEDDLSCCNATICDDNTTCNINTSNTDTNTTMYNIIVTMNEQFHFLACRLNHTNASCALYNISCISAFCEDDSNNDDDDDDDDIEMTDKHEEEDSDDNTKSIFLAFMVIFLVGFLISLFVNLTLALMVRDMKNERVQDNLPNPYSCIFSAVKALCLALPCGSSGDHDLEGDEKPPQKTYTKPRDKTAGAQKQSRQNEKQSEPDSPDHDADDYEEMDPAMKRDSFMEEGPEDIYQNQ